MRDLKRLTDRAVTVISTLLTWVTFLSFPVTVVFTIYYCFVDFNFSKVFCGVILLFVFIYLNKSL